MLAVFLSIFYLHKCYLFLKDFGNQHVSDSQVKKHVFSSGEVRHVSGLGQGESNFFSSIDLAHFDETLAVLRESLGDQLGSLVARPRHR